MIPLLPFRPAAAERVVPDVLGEWSQRRSGYAASGTISQIDDVSPHLDHAVQGTAGNRPALDLDKAPGRIAIRSISGDYLAAPQDAQIVWIAGNVFVQAALAAERGIAARAKASGTNPALEIAIG